MCLNHWSLNQAVQAGNFLFISGQLAGNPKEGKLIVDNITLLAHQIVENINHFGSCSSSLKDAVQSTVYLSSMSLFEEFNHEHATHFESNFPDRAKVE
jgi:2-iminobutanoate/2-iminopropanoate deaminase